MVPKRSKGLSFAKKTMSNITTVTTVSEHKQRESWKYALMPEGAREKRGWEVEAETPEFCVRAVVCPCDKINPLWRVTKRFNEREGNATAQTRLGVENRAREVQESLFFFFLLENQTSRGQGSCCYSQKHINTISQFLHLFIKFQPEVIFPRESCREMGEWKV